MQVIPVIDLKGGQAVHARKGARDAYAPIRSRLCQGSAPLDLLRGYRALFPFASAYLADLDAIAGGPPSVATYEALLRDAPGLDLWVDCGIREAAEAEALLARHAVTLVLGSESLSGSGVLAALGDLGDRLVLSLDFREERFLGEPAVLRESALWPGRVAVMTLARVGSDLGPDLERIEEIRRRAGPRAVYAAGGVGSTADLHELARRGCAGALVASVLHDGRVQRNDLESLAGAALAGGASSSTTSEASG